MLRSVLQVLIGVLFLVPQMANTFLVVNYELDKASITAEHCVNKSRPELNCNGQCHLNNQLQSQEQNKGEQPQPEYLDIEFNFLVGDGVHAFLQSTSSESFNDRITAKLTHGIYSRLDRPPKILALV